VVLAALVSPPPLAAHVERMSPSEIAAASPAIVVATVEARASRWNALHTLILTDYTLRVEERLRGAEAERITLTVPGGTLGRIADDSCLTVHLQTGARYLLFLDDLEHPTLVPVVGAEQGLFREIPGAPSTFVAAGAGSGPLTLRGAPVTFRDFVGAVRSLALHVPLAPRPASSAAAGQPGLPAKVWSPLAPPAPVAGALPPQAAPAALLPPLPDAEALAGAERVEIGESEAVLQTPRRPAAPPTAKFLYHELAKRPVVVNPLTGSDFAPWDQYQMAYWNRYSGDLFRVSPAPTATWAYDNGISDIVGFPPDAVMKNQYGYGWTDLGQGVLGVTFARRVDGVVVEADVAFNPAKSWTLDDLEATRAPDSPFSFKETVLHELGHVWGLEHPWDDGDFVAYDSVMNYKFRQYYVAELFADDTAAVRHAFPPGVAIRDGLINAYVTVPNDRYVIPDYVTPSPKPATVRAGRSFGLNGPIKIENVGTVALVNPIVEVYLAPQRLSLDGAVLIQRVTVRRKIPPGGVVQLKLTGLKVPLKTPPGDYGMGYLLRIPKDAYTDNNFAWSLDGFGVTVTR
jgi:hypothetical protein